MTSEKKFKVKFIFMTKIMKVSKFIQILHLTTNQKGMMAKI